MIAVPLIADDSRLSRAFWRFWLATGIDFTGKGMYAATVPLLAAALTPDPRLLTVVSAAAYLPWLLLSLPAGTIVDRYCRITLMRRAQFAAAAIVAVTAVLVAVGRMDITTLTVLAFALGACDVVFGNAAQAALPDLVADRMLPRANGNQQVVLTVGQQFAGPPAGSALFAVSAALAFGAEALLFVASAVVLLTVPKGKSAHAEPMPMRAAIADGVRWLVRHRLLRTLAVLLSVNTFSWQLANATLVLVVTRELGVGVSAFGLVLAAAACGGLVGGLVNGWIADRFGTSARLVSALVLTVLGYAGAGWAPNAVTLGICLAVNGFATTLFNVVSVTLRQRLVPAGMRGRVNSVYRMFAWGLMPFGVLASGLVAHELGLRAPYQLAAAVRLIALVVALPVLIRAVSSTECS
ncbi:MFS transporter [Kibdelosporangium phytohabitans]|uniref:Antibiotic transporter n=1 Tax=Kibdelosporangium phytohabitans TaxID=860235 RepID=A0A0N7F485_9PSEU|nr:MFS transporter [Kibdelosporangium phytohabitans]ALG10727.1 antibiotic transporter [Kibdelosporangium phytohabitans]MBE1461866.1 MFS family permease [Kibdelosporangium phytohabitans]